MPARPVGWGRRAKRSRLSARVAPPMATAAASFRENRLTVAVAGSRQRLISIEMLVARAQRGEAASGGRDRPFTSRR